MSGGQLMSPTEDGENTMRTTFAALALALSVSPVLIADTLVLTNGRRLQGELVGVSGRDIEFEERDGRRRVLRIPRNEIARIEFDDGSFLGSDRENRREERREVDGGMPRGMRERSANVNAREAWTDTGIEVRAGQSIYFAASGETRWGPGRRDGAEGERNSPVNQGRPLPERAAASLIGRIGDGNDVFFIGGDPGPFRARSSGRLYLGINDDVLTDNSGSLRVTISY
jgi:hypothetical protein